MIESSKDSIGEAFGKVLERFMKEWDKGMLQDEAEGLASLIAAELGVRFPAQDTSVELVCIGEDRYKVQASLSLTGYVKPLSVSIWDNPTHWKYLRENWFGLLTTIMNDDQGSEEVE